MNLLEVPEENPPYPHRNRPRPPLTVRLSAAFLLGFLAGTLFMLAGAADRLDRLQLDNQRLNAQVTRLQERIAVLEQDARTRQSPKIEDVILTLGGVERPATRQQLENELDRLAGTLRGKPLTEVNPVIVIQIFDGRILATNEGQYRIRFHWLVLGRQTRIFLQAEPLPGT